MRALIAAIQISDTALAERLLQNVQAQQFRIQAQLRSIRTEESFLRSLPTHLQQLPGKAGELMNRVITTLEPRSDFENLGESLERYINRIEQEGFLTELLTPLTSLGNDLTSLFDQLDISFLEGPIQTAATEVQGAVDTVNGAFAQVVAQVASLFDELEGLINQVDVQSVINALLTKIREFQQTVQQLMDQAFAPIRDAISAAIQAFSDAVGQFDPADIISALQTAIQSVVGVMNNPAIQEQLDQIKSVLTEVSEAPGCSLLPDGQ